MTNLQMIRKLPARDLSILLNTIIENVVCDYCGKDRCQKDCSGESIPGTSLKKGCIEGLHLWLNQEVEGNFWDRPDGNRVFVRKAGCHIE